MRKKKNMLLEHLKQKHHTRKRSTLYFMNPMCINMNRVTTTFLSLSLPIRELISSVLLNGSDAKNMLAKCCLSHRCK